MKSQTFWIILAIIFLCVITVVCAGGVFLLLAVPAIGGIDSAPANYYYYEPTEAAEYYYYYDDEEDSSGEELFETPMPTQAAIAPPEEPPAEGESAAEGADVETLTVGMDFNRVYQQVIGGLPQGSALFNPPAGMRMGDTQTIEVRIVPVSEEELSADEELQATLMEDFEGGEEIIVIPMRVSTVMRAKLTGSGFEIIPLTEEEQIQMIDNPYLRWLWDVTPQEKGTQKLTLTLSVVVNAEGLGDKTHTTTEIREVEISGNTGYAAQQFLSGNWEWIITSMLVPAAGWAVNWFRKRGKKS